MTDDDEIGNGWELARVHAQLNVAPAYVGPTTLEGVRPPAWSCGGTPEEADEFVARVESGDRRESSAPGAVGRQAAVSGRTTIHTAPPP